MSIDSAFLENTNCECDVTLDTWLKDALPLLPGIVRSVASRELVLACREFFERSYAWQAIIRDQDARAGSRQYWLSPYDQYANVVGILAVAFQGNFLSPLVRRPPHSSEQSTTSPAYFHVTHANTPDVVELYQPLSTAVDEALDFYVALTPKQNVEHLPRVAAIKYYDAILDGFLARVMMHPNKPYSQPQLGAMRRKSFLSWCARYAGQAKQGYVNAQAWRFPSGWSK